MRRGIVAVTLLGLFGGLVATVGLRSRTPHDAPAASTSATPAASGSASASPARSAVAPSSSASAPASASAAPPRDAGPARLFDRTLRVAGLGWEAVVPGVLVDKGLKPGVGEGFGAAGLAVEIAVLDAMSAVEGALARGGADKDGADVALVPLPTFVASYERLRALSPEVFFVVGWSRGREALVGPKDLLTSPPASPKLAGAPGTAATFLGLFALDAAGAPADRVTLLPPTGKPGDAVAEAVDRGADPLPALVTTADASRLVPLVAVAQHGLVEKHGPALAALASKWLDGQAELAADPPAAARVVAAIPGAPEPLGLLARLGETAPASLAEAARLAGLSGRGAVTLEALFQEAWRIWRAAGQLSTPAPEVTPISTGVVRALVQSRGPSVGPEPAPKPRAGGAERVLLAHPMAGAKLEDAEVARAIGLYAGVFDRSRVRVAVRGAGGVDAARTKKLVEAATGQFDLAPGRVVAGDKLPAKASAVVEVLEAR
jgi:hypothetical protein